MNTAKDHYDKQLASVYSWMAGTPGERWVLNISSYPKLRIDKSWVCDRLQKLKLQVIQNEIINGMICIVAQKSKL
jgi:hypothetical protein